MLSREERGVTREESHSRGDTLETRGGEERGVGTRHSALERSHTREERGEETLERGEEESLSFERGGVTHSRGEGSLTREGRGHSLERSRHSALGIRDGWELVGYQILRFFSTLESHSQNILKPSADVSIQTRLLLSSVKYRLLSPLECVTPPLSNESDSSSPLSSVSSPLSSRV